MRIPIHAKTRRHLALVAIAAITLAAAVSAQNQPFVIKNLKQESLRGLNNYVVMVTIEPEPEKLGISRQTLETAVELRLRQSGINVWTPTPGEKAPLPLGLLGVELLVIEETVKSPPLVFSLTTYVNQGVKLTRNPEHQMGARTWWDHGVYKGGADTQIRIRNAIDEQLDSFLNNHLTVNPKK